MSEQTVTPEMLADVIAEESFENRPAKKPPQPSAGEQVNRTLGMLLGPFTLIVAILWAMGCFDGSVNQRRQPTRSKATHVQTSTRVASVRSTSH